MRNKIVTKAILNGENGQKEMERKCSFTIMGGRSGASVLFSNEL